MAHDKIQLIRELGQGSFGMVYEGTASGLKDKGTVVKVAVKVSLKVIGQDVKVR